MRHEVILRGSKVINILALVLICTLIICTSESVLADQIIVNFSGRVTSVGDPYMYIPSGAIEIGDILQGSYSYDTDTLDSDPSPNKGSYLYTTNPYGITVYLNEYTFASVPDTPTFYMLIGDSVYDGPNPPHDYYYAQSRNNLPGPFIGIPVALMRVTLRDYTMKALSNDSLPETAPNPNDWPDNHHVIIYGYDAMYVIIANIIWMGLGDSPITGVNDQQQRIISLKQNYPNPFTTTTMIEYNLPSPAPVTINIYNVLGQRIAQIKKPLESAGPHSIIWNGSNDRGVPVSSGIYLYCLKAGGLSQTLKMIRLR